MSHSGTGRDGTATCRASCDCGRPISETRIFCRACKEAAIAKILQGEADERLIRNVLLSSTDHERRDLAMKVAAKTAGVTETEARLILELPRRPVDESAG